MYNTCCTCTFNYHMTLSNPPWTPPITILLTRWSSLRLTPIIYVSACHAVTIALTISNIYWYTYMHQYISWSVYLSVNSTDTRICNVALLKGLYNPCIIHAEPYILHAVHSHVNATTTGTLYASACSRMFSANLPCAACQSHAPFLSLLAILRVRVDQGIGVLRHVWLMNPTY